jgi:hypothetical protein
MNKNIQKLLEKHGATHKPNLGVYQFYTHELEAFVADLLESVAKECQGWMWTEGDIKTSYRPKEEMEGYNQGVRDCLAEIRTFDKDINMMDGIQKPAPCCAIPETDYSGKCFKCGKQLFERDEND